MGSGVRIGPAHRLSSYDMVWAHGPQGGTALVVKLYFQDTCVRAAKPVIVQP